MKFSKGFTLIEMMVVISIIGVLVVLGITSYSSAQRTARDARRLGDIKNIMTALEQYYTDNGSYPISSLATCPISGDGPWCCSGVSNWIPNLSSYISGGVPSQFGDLQPHCYNSAGTFTGGYGLHYTLERGSSNASGTQIEGPGFPGNNDSLHPYPRYQIRGTGN